MARKLIDISHISKSYGDNLVLDDLNLYINENQKTVSLERKLETWKTVACIMLVVIIIGVIIVTF